MSADTNTTAVRADPLFISVTDAARILGISRSYAYEMAHQWIETNGERGIPAMRLGRRLLVRKSVLHAWASPASA